MCAAMRYVLSEAPGIFAAGDVRHGSIKRVAAAVGEGATAVQQLKRYLESVPDGSRELAGAGRQGTEALEV
jgi:NADPH-dependent glutamate synthase beta subunit-like oxidoreductase